MNEVKRLGEKTKALRAAFPHTIPVLTGFLFLSMAYGILMESKGYGLGWIALFSIFVYAGSAQYMAINFLVSAFNPIYALLMTLMINARHLFYGISMLERYGDSGRLKPYLIFGMSDETFSITCSVDPPAGINKNWFFFFITFLNQIYWVLGSILGGLLGPMIAFNTEGLDFVLTALFVVIFLGQWKSNKDHVPASIGVICSAICLIIFGPDNFIIPSMIAISLVLMIYEKEHTKKKRIREGL